jgi:hypothetical protein
MRAIGPCCLPAAVDPRVRLRTLMIAPGVVISLVSGPAFAQASAVITVTARIIAPCTVTSDNPQSTCSDRTLALQSNVTNASARISTSDTETVVTHKGGLPPRIEQQGNQVSVSF